MGIKGRAAGARAATRKPGWASLRLLVGAAGAGLVLVGGLSTAAVANSAAATMAPIAKLTISPTPIAPDGTLLANAAVTLTVTAEDATSRPIPGATVYLEFSSSAGGKMTTHNTTLNGTPTGYKAGLAGTIKMTYHQPGSPVPTSGASTVAAFNAPSGANVVASDSYVFAPSPTVAGYKVSPTPIATTKSLAPSSIVPVTITAVDSKGVAVPHGAVYLSITPATGGGTAFAHGLALTSTPKLFNANSTGAVTFSYHAPASLPTSGTDTVTIANAASGATITVTDTYTF
jgi:hypothetical protein